MGTGYTRNDSGNNIADGNVINAADFDGEFDAIVSAFATDGHTHDGTAAEGGAIQKLGPSQEVEVDSGAIFPASDGATDLGKSTKEWKDLYIDGVINTDNISADAATITGNVSVGGTLNIGGAVDTESTMSVQSNASVGGTLAVTGDTDVSNLSASGTLDVAGNASIGGTFQVTGEFNLTDVSASGTLDVAGNGSVGGTLNVNGATTTGAISADGTLAVSSNASVGGTFAVGGTTNLATANITGTVNVTGDTTLDNVSANGTLDVSGNGSVGGTFNVEGDLKNNAGNLTIAATSYIVEVKGGGSTDAELKLNCRSNSHGQTIKSQEHSAGVTNTMLLPKGANSTLVSEVGTATLTNKTLDSAPSVSAAGVVNVGTNLSVLGNAEVGGTFKITSTVSAEAALNVGGLLNVTGSAGLAGNVNLGNATADSVVVGGVLTANASANLTGNVGVGGTIIGASTISDSKGDIRDLDVSRTVDATAEIALTDLGQMVQLNSAGVQALIPSASNMTGAFSIGDIVSIVNTTSTTGSITSQVNAFVGGAVSVTGTITLGANGIANIYFVSADGCIITGNVS